MLRITNDLSSDDFLIIAVILCVHAAFTGWVGSKVHSTIFTGFLFLFFFVPIKVYGWYCFIKGKLCKKN